MCNVLGIPTTNVTPKKQRESNTVASQTAPSKRPKSSLALLHKSCRSGQCVSPANCSATTATWTHHSRTCTAPLTAANHKTTKIITDTTAPDTGSATYRCWDGTFTKQYSGCGNNCALQVVLFGLTVLIPVPALLPPLPPEESEPPPTPPVTEQGTAKYLLRRHRLGEAVRYLLFKDCSTQKQFHLEERW